MKAEVKLKPGDMQARLTQAQKQIKNASPGYQRVATFLDQWVQQNFRSEGGKVGGWPPFKNGGRVVTGRGQPTHIDTSAKLLQKTGHLRASFVPFATRKTAGIGSNLPYSVPHNDGVRGRLPQRRMLPLRKEVITDARKILKGYVKKVLDDVSR